MLSPKRILGFPFRLSLIYGLLVIPWPGVREAYRDLYSVGGNLVFRSLIPGGSVSFRPVPPTTQKYDTQLDLVNLRSGAQGMVFLPSRLAFLPTILLASLVLATPLSWRRKLLALLWGLALVNVAIACKLFLTVLYTFSGARLALFATSWPWDEMVAVSYRVTDSDVVTFLMLPVFIWIAVSFRRADWMRLLPPPATKSQTR